jgi:hypothetical protein
MPIYEYEHIREACSAGKVFEVKQSLQENPLDLRRDDGVYENVTRREGESRYMERDKPETMPDLNKTIKD